MAAELKFPVPGEVTDEDPSILRTAEDIVALANAANGTSYTNLAPAVQEWARKKGLALGWGGVHFPLQYPNKSKRAGVVFVKKSPA